MKGNGLMIWPMVLVTIFMQMVAFTKVIGKMTSNMVSVKNNGLIVLNLKATIIWGRNKVKEHSNGQMEVSM